MSTAANMLFELLSRSASGHVYRERENLANVESETNEQSAKPRIRIQRVGSSYQCHATALACLHFFFPVFGRSSPVTRGEKKRREELGANLSNAPQAQLTPANRKSYHHGRFSSRSRC